MLWLRVKGLLTAATLACAAAHTAHAEPRAADGCKRAAFRVLIDVGHTEQAPGAMSARGVPEFVFNLNLAKRIEQQLLAAGFRRSVLLITDGPAGKGLAERVKRAKDLAADLFLSIHHDSVPDQLLEKWEFDGEQRNFSDRFSGHSIFISQDNSDYAGSLLHAGLLGGQLRKRGLKYTPHYTDPIMGYRKRLLIDAQAGVYRYDQLIVLRDTDMPAVLLEAGSIINREEELRMGSVEHQALIIAAVTALTYLRRLCEDLSGILSVTIEVLGEDGLLPTTVIQPVGLIVNELVTNAAKHGAGKITVTYKCHDVHELVVCDQGVGFPSGFDPATSSTGLGMRVVHVLATQLGGDVKAGVNPAGQGACFTVTFPR